MLYWFRHDLRLHDNANLNAALRTGQDVVPVFVMDDRWHAQNPIGVRRMGPHRRGFLLESLHELRRVLKDHGLPLLYREGDPVRTLTTLAAELGSEQVYASREVGTEEQAQEAELAARLDLRMTWGQYLVHPDKLPFALERLHHTFTRFRRSVEAHLDIAPAVPAEAYLGGQPALAPGEIPLPGRVLDARTAFRDQGGCEAGLKRLQHYLWESDYIASYKETRNGLIGEAYSGKFSPFLAWGCLSPVQIHSELQRYEEQRRKNESTYWMFFELLWRDFFKYVAMKHGALIFQLKGIQNSQLAYHQHQGMFEQWQQGCTGDPFVDANMKELAATGWMSNRGRQNVASYLCHDLQLDWRWGAWWFEHCLLDYDVSSNWGNWMYLAGVGNDPRNRKFNTKRQAEMYDPQGAFQRLWLPDLPG